MRLFYFDLLCRKFPTKHPFFLQKVEYDKSAQELLVEWRYRDFLRSYDNHAYKKRYPLAPDGLTYADHEQSWRTHGQIPKGPLGDKFSLKHTAFREEREWRLITPLQKGEPCSYRPVGNRVVPYCAIALEEVERRPPIIKIILGPKHVSPPEVVANLLKHSGYGAVSVERSTAPYY